MLSVSKELIKLIEIHLWQSYLTKVNWYHNFKWNITAAQFNTKKTHFT